MEIRGHDRKDLTHMTIRQLEKSKKLTFDELNTLSNMELNLCDRCGQIECSEQLYWLEYYYTLDGGEPIPKKMRKYTALCSACHDKLK